MPKRKLTQEVSVGSDLSPPPKGLLENGQGEQCGESNVRGPASKKRKVKEDHVEDDQPANKTSRKKRAKTEEEFAEAVATTESDKKGKKTVKVEDSVSEAQGAADRGSEASKSKSKKGRGRSRAQPSKPEVAAEANGDDAVGKQKVKRKRKTQEEKDAEAMPLATRTTGHKLFLGAHVSASGGVHNSVPNSVHIGGNSFALFLKSQRKWANPPLVEAHSTAFHDHCKTHSYTQGKHVVPHGSYLVNLAHTDKERTKQAYYAFVDDLYRCEKLGIGLYNFHPGVANSTNGDRAAAIAHLAANLNRAHAETSTVVTLLENMAASGSNTLGTTFEDLRDIIALTKDQSRVGVCLDTCHAFAAGYDLRAPDAYKQTMDHFEATVGFKYLRALHINDSKAPFDSHRDLHANIGTGFLGLRAFHNVVNDPRMEGLPLILETPLEAKDADGVLVKDAKGKMVEDKGIWAGEIKLLESLVGMDAEGEEFLTLERDLARKGRTEKEKMLEQMEKAREKKEKKGKGKGKKQLEKEEEPGEEERVSSLSELESEGES